MIDVKCGCGWKWSRPESAPKTTRTCDQCGHILTLACAETLPPGAGAGDFDAYLEIVDGPDRVGERVFLGGVADITVGRLEGVPVFLRGTKVSRHHCRLTRVDFGPSRWSVSDNESTHGLQINGHRATFKELADGDLLRVGEYELRYAHTPVAQPVPGLPGVGLVEPGTGVTCPSCERELPPNAKICIGCGIKLATGRPVLLSAPADQEDFDRAAPWIKLLTWIMPVTPFPIPLMSEAFGNRKPWTIRGIAALTILVSTLFLLTSWPNRHSWNVPGKNLELWPPGMSGHPAKIDIALTPGKVKRLIAQMDDEEATEFMATRERLRGTVPDTELDRRAMEEFLSNALTLMLGQPGQFQPHQLLTHALLHDNESLLGFAAHLGGNLVFLLVFGSRINAVLGNLATLILYPILAVGAALTHLWLGHPQGPMLGASGAIMGLAGMYLILFPVHRVYCGMWIRFRLLWCGMKIFALRGFWILLIYFAFDMLMATLQAGSSTAHFAHIGGFVLGMALALLILASRLFNCGGGDLLSVTLGRYAWPLIGRPARHLQQAPAA